MADNQKLDESDAKLILECIDTREQLREEADEFIEKAKELRKEANLLNNKNLAEKWDVSVSTISHINLARRWRNV